MRDFDDIVTVTCTRCGTAYLGVNPGQAADCATTLKVDGHVVGHYGSKVFDLHQGRVTGAARNLAPGTLCDSCVTEMRMDGEIINIHDIAQAVREIDLPKTFLEAPKPHQKTKILWGGFLPVIGLFSLAVGQISPWLGLFFFVVFLTFFFFSLPRQENFKLTDVSHPADLQALWRAELHNKICNAISEDTCTTNALSMALARLRYMPRGRGIPHRLPITLTHKSNRAGCDLTIHVPRNRDSSVCDTILCRVHLGSDSTVSQLMEELSSSPRRHSFAIQESRIMLAFRVDAISAHIRNTILGKAQTT